MTVLCIICKSIKTLYDLFIFDTENILLSLFTQKPWLPWKSPKMYRYLPRYGKSENENMQNYV